MFKLKKRPLFNSTLQETTDKKGFQTYWQPGGVEVHSQGSLEGVEAYLPRLEGWKHTYRAAWRGGSTPNGQPGGMEAHLPGSLER
jgi:hypothetical protein